MSELTLDFEPRGYQLPFLTRMATGCLSACLVWHRRCGKDLTAWIWMITAALQRPGNYFYYFPTGELGRRILWNGKTRDGKGFLDFLPKGSVGNMHQTTMRIDLINGSMIQVLGTDDVDRAAVGTSAHGAIFSEYSIQNPDAAMYISPILRETGGWAVYIYTPRGHNHGYDLYNHTKNNEKWHTEKLGIDKTLLLKDSDLDDDRALGRPESFLQQEYYCSFDAALEGSYFGEAMARAREQNRITNVPYDARLPVHTYWDLGISDLTTIWFVQRTPTEYRIIDYYENNGQGLGHYIDYLKTREYMYGAHVAPHDIAVREFSSGRSRLDAARDLGIDFFVGSRTAKEDQIDAARAFLSQCYFDKTNCEVGISSLLAYRGKEDPKNKVQIKPVHDRYSHAADSFMLLATQPEYTAHTTYSYIQDMRVEQNFDAHSGRSYGESYVGNSSEYY